MPTMTNRPMASKVKVKVNELKGKVGELEEKVGEF